MPIVLPPALPAAEALEQENIFVMAEKRALHQNIRPLRIVVVNLMPTKIATETQLARLLANTPLQVELTFVRTGSHQSKNTPESHLQEFYTTFDHIRHQRFDGMIITGAPVEQMPFEEVDYWQELCEIMDFSKNNVWSTFMYAGEHRRGCTIILVLKKFLFPKKCLAYSPTRSFDPLILW